MPNDYKLSLTLNTERNLRIADIATALHEIEEMLSDIERNVRQIPSSEAKWGVEEDPRLTFVASVNGVDETSLRRIVTVAKEGLEAASHADSLAIEWPVEFGVRARASAEAIISLLNNLESITVEATGSSPVELSLPSPDLPRTRRMYSSVDGILDSLGHRSESTLYAGIREWQTGNRVRCSLDNERWHGEISSRSLWDKHVTVYGRVTYNADGVPQSINEVTAIDLREGETPLSELEGRLPRLTGRSSTEGFIRRLRGDNA